jgi:hypothetical protein
VSQNEALAIDLSPPLWGRPSRRHQGAVETTEAGREGVWEKLNPCHENRNDFDQLENKGFLIELGLHG